MELSEYRAVNDISEIKMAEILGVSTRAIQYWESGKRSPRRRHLQKIKEVTNGKVTADDFFFPDEPLTDARA